MISVSQLPVGDEKAKNTWITIHHETEKDYWWFTSKRNLIIQLIQSCAPTSSTLLEMVVAEANYQVNFKNWAIKYSALIMTYCG
jgi:hypothetical protein